MLAYTVYFCWTQVLWTDINTGDCLSGYNVFDFINWLVLLLITVWPTITVGFGMCICVCCGPCIYSAVREYLNRAESEQAERNGVVDAIVKRTYNAEDFKGTNECAICMVEFTEDDEVTPLPCPGNHYFHSACI